LALFMRLLLENEAVMHGVGKIAWSENRP